MHTGTTPIHKTAQTVNRVKTGKAAAAHFSVACRFVFWTPIRSMSTPHLEQLPYSPDPPQEGWRQPQCFSSLKDGGMQWGGAGKRGVRRHHLTNQATLVLVALSALL